MSCIDIHVIDWFIFQEMFLHLNNIVLIKVTTNIGSYNIKSSA
jgi:hypothetical protein